MVVAKSHSNMGVLRGRDDSEVREGELVIRRFQV